MAGRHQLLDGGGVRYVALSAIQILCSVVRIRFCE